MSSLGCKCGHIIRDTTNGLHYKASLLSDINGDALSDWIVIEFQSYVEAVERGATEAWLIGRGYTQDFAALGLDHGNIMHDHLTGRYRELKRDVYECQACGRFHLEQQVDNQFASYRPDEECNPVDGDAE
jgi:hypothetical protein